MMTRRQGLSYLVSSVCLGQVFGHGSTLDAQSAKLPASNDVVGTWHYRSFVNNPQKVADLNVILFGEGDFVHRRNTDWAGFWNRRFWRGRYGEIRGNGHPWLSDDHPVARCWNGLCERRLAIRLSRSPAPGVAERGRPDSVDRRHSRPFSATLKRCGRYCACGKGRFVHCVEELRRKYKLNQTFRDPVRQKQAGGFEQKTGFASRARYSRRKADLAAQMVYDRLPNKEGSGKAMMQGFKPQTSYRIGKTVCVLVAIIALVLGLTTAADFSIAGDEDANSIALKHLDHVGINVTDLTKSAEWYENVLGFKIFHKWNTTWMIRRGEMKIGLFSRPKAQKSRRLRQQNCNNPLRFCNGR